MSRSILSRRSAMTTMAAGSLAASISTIGGDKNVNAAETTTSSNKLPLKGRIHHTACLWCYSKIPKEQFFKTCAEIGLVGVDLVNESDFPLLKKYGLVATMVSGVGGIGDALNDNANHSKCMEQFKTLLPAAAREGFKNVITFSGNRRGKSDEEGWDNCLTILKEAVKIAEDQGVNICMELLNSKVDHKDYQCDHTPWGVELCKRVNSPRFKLLYDIYHMQIMEGDVIRTIRDNIQHIAHFHTGGVPGRHEIDESQELYYPAIMKAIVDLGYEGYVAQEFIPARDPIE